MGIHKLLSYIRNIPEIYFPQKENNSNIYISNVIYFDMTYKLIEAYGAFLKELKNKKKLLISGDEAIVMEMFKYISKELSSLFDKLINYNRAIYVFVDYSTMEPEVSFNVVW